MSERSPPSALPALARCGADLTAPALEVSAPHGRLSVLAALFPIGDVLLVVVVAYLIMSGGTRAPSLWLLAASIAAMFAADLIYMDRALGPNTPNAPEWFEPLVLVAFMALAAPGLHPSMRTLTTPQAINVRAFSVSRGVVLAVVIALPSLLALLSPLSGTRSTVLRAAILTIVFAGTMVWRFAETTASWLRADRAERWRATHDELTGLGNGELARATLTGWCDRVQAEGTSLGLLLLDLDRFRRINETWGRRVGDELLRAVAERLTATMPPEALVCRLAMDRFVIALPPTPPPIPTEELADQLIHQLDAPFSLSVGDVTITASIGVAKIPGSPIEPMELLHAADMAMYAAKDAGRRRWWAYSASIGERVHRRAVLEHALRGALERAELSVSYQPIVNLHNRNLSGFEALMRWHHPELGSVSPAEFIPIAEDTGMIMSSGGWLLREAVSQVACWQRRYPNHDLHVSVNLSVRQLRNPSLVSDIAEILNDTKLPVRALWLEITESRAMEDSRRSLKTLRSLRDLGATLCIDDFGTGYSSLSYLVNLPVEVVKIDRSLISDVGGEHEADAVVQSVISMAHILGRMVVAEGIETMSQHDWLRAHGCDFGQGYLYGAPREAREQEKRLLVPAGANGSNPTHYTGGSR